MSFCPAVAKPHHFESFFHKPATVAAVATTAKRLLLFFQTGCPGPWSTTYYQASTPSLGVPCPPFLFHLLTNADFFSSSLYLLCMCVPVAREEADTPCLSSDDEILVFLIKQLGSNVYNEYIRTRAHTRIRGLFHLPSNQKREARNFITFVSLYDGSLFKGSWVDAFSSPLARSCSLSRPCELEPLSSLIAKTMGRGTNPST